ncbi:MAG TPA: sterol desaturase family protein [Rhizomicrobium sp.]|nr:sterol desaturase family protein [Rhizomicrobium sp.]
MTIGNMISGSERSALSASPRLFRNPLLDRLSRVHHLLPAVLYLPIVFLLLYAAGRAVSPEGAVAGFLGGYVLWTLVEYFGHRFLFHHRFTTPLGRRAQFLMHGVHHDHPNDPLRLVMPPLMSVPIMLAAWAVLRAVFGPTVCLPVLAGFVAGYLAYDMLHYHLHHRQPKTRIGRFLRLRHMHHHFHDETSSFGVSAPWWDYVFGSQSRISKS